MRRAAILLTCLAAALAACGDGEEGEATTAAASATVAELAGRTFVSTAVHGRRLVPRTVVTLGFETGTVRADAGCNTLTGGWSIEDGRLETGELAATMIGCPPALAAQDAWLRSFLADAPRIALEGDALRLDGDGAAIELRAGRPAGAPRPIVGTTWKLTTIGGRDGSMASVPAGVRAPTLRIASDGRVELFAGCNRGGGSAEVRDDGFVVFGPLALTKMACDAAATRVEAAVTAVLDGSVAAGFTGEGDLSLTRDGGSLVFTAVR